MDKNIQYAENDVHLQLLHAILNRMVQMEELLKSSYTSQAVDESIVVPPSIFWTASKTDLIELIYAIYATGACNHGKVQIKELTQLFEQLFGLPLGNTSLRFQEILRRKESTAFLSVLKTRLELYITRIDERRK